MPAQGSMDVAMTLTIVPAGNAQPALIVRGWLREADVLKKRWQL